MLAIDRILGAPPEDGLVSIAEHDFHADRNGQRATLLSIRIVLEPTPDIPPPRLFEETFGQDAAGELYLLSRNGTVYRLVEI